MTYTRNESFEYFYLYRKDLHYTDGVVLYNDRIVVPPSLRDQILESLDAAHQCTGMMHSGARSSIFWPGISKAIQQQRDQCNSCNRNAPSQPSAPPFPATKPEYPFQCICADFFQHEGSHYLIAVDRYSNWPIIERAKEGSKGLIDSLRQHFSTFGISDELSSDEGPEFMADSTKTFLKNWGVRQRLSSVAFPHSNCRAEIGVKTAKRLITDNTGPNGNLDTDKLQRAILQYRNCPDPTTGLSPAMCVFGRPIRDFIPIQPGRYQPHPTWVDTLDKREEALRNRHMQAAERWTEHTRRLPPLKVGDHVRVQNQVGPHPLKWDRTRRIVEVRQFDQYVIRMDGSGRATMRNRKFLRKFIPVIQNEERRHLLDDFRFVNPSPPLTTSQRINTPMQPESTLPTAPSVTTNHQEPSTPLVPGNTGGNQTESSEAQQTSETRKPTQRKTPLALRRLMDHNKKGLRE